MSTDTNVSQVVINQMTEAQLENATIQPNQIYVTPDEDADDTKANVDASNLSSANVTSWQNKFHTEPVLLVSQYNSGGLSAGSRTLNDNISNYRFINIMFQYSNGYHFGTTMPVETFAGLCNTSSKALSVNTDALVEKVYYVDDTHVYVDYFASVTVSFYVYGIK